jgi:hypothetical protein
VSDQWELADRRDLVELIRHGDVAVATDSLLELTHRETDAAWLEIFLVSQASHHVDGNVRELAVTCIGHSARLNGAIVNDSVYRSLRAFLKDRRLSGRALGAISDIDVFTGRHWSSAEWIMLQISAMDVRLKAGDLRFWQS